MIALIDMLLRFAGIIVALAIALFVGGGHVFLGLSPLFNSSWPLWKRALVLCASVPVAALSLVLVWRIVRFAGGYTGSSEYPFHFVVRWLF